MKESNKNRKPRVIKLKAVHHPLHKADYVFLTSAVALVLILAVML